MMYDEEAGNLQATMYDEETASLEPMMYEEEAGFAPRLPTQWQFIWLCSLILSFCYELPLVQVTAMDRLNPRFFDIVFIVGMITVFPYLNRVGQTPRLFRIWTGIVATFSVCALVWFPFFPWYYGKYSIWFALKYLQGLFCIYTAVNMPLTSQQKKILHHLVMTGGIVVTLFAIPQYLRGGVGRFIVARTGEELTPGLGFLYSSLGRGYFHIAMFSSMSSVMTLALFQSAKTTLSRVLYLGIGLLIGWPAFFCGARAGVVTCLIGWVSLFLLSKASFKVIVLVTTIGVLGFLFLYVPKVLSIEYLAEKSATFRRFQGLEESGGKGKTIASRLTLDWYQLDKYKWQGWRIPFVGGGFMVVPVTELDGSLRYRIGYGVHNDYLFALEQGGLVAFILLIAFLIVCRNNLKRMHTLDKNEADRAFAIGMHAFFHGLLVAMWGGQIFWHGFEKVNFNTYMILLFVLASTMSFSLSSESVYLSDSNPEYEGTFIA